VVLTKAPAQIRYAVAALIIAAAYGLRVALDSLLGPGTPFITFYPAVCVIAWLAGWRAGLAAMVFSIAAAWISFLPDQAPILSAASISVVVLFAVFAASLVYLVQALHNAVAQRDESRRASEAAHATLKSLLEVAPVGIALLDPQMRYTMVNKALAEMNGIPIHEHLGRSVAEVLPEIAPVVAPTFDEVMRTGRGLPPIELEAATPAAPGEKRVFLESWFPVGASGDTPSGVGAIVLEVSAERRAEAALRELGRRKDEFLSTLSHEMRTPLGAIANSLSFLRQRNDPRALDIVERQAGHLARLVDDLYDLARTQEGKLSLVKAPLQLERVVADAVEMVQGAAKAKQQRISLQPPVAPLALEADAERLTQVFCNLMNNAIKFSPEGSEIALDMREENGNAIVRVRDQGRGIAPELLPRIFDMYWQGTSGERTAGLGIGLALAQSFVRLHGGEIKARSAGLGRGSEFTVRLPLT
jgi:PAS domain S-box-containing protein